MIFFLELMTTMLTLAIGNSDSSWRKWHSRRLRDTPNAELQRSLGLHMDIRNLLETADVDGNSRKKGWKAVERHREAIDKLRNLHLGGFNITGLVNTLHYTENYAKEYYHKLMGLDAIPIPDHPSEDDLASALKDATGIDATDMYDGDAELFRIMTMHWEHKPPPQTLGVSAKFHKDGRIERKRYHVALHLPCEIGWDGEKLRSSSKAAAFALKAPPLVHKWIEEITGLPGGRIQSMGFGLAVLGDGSRAGKIYVVNPGGSPMPHLPLGGDKVLKDALPNVGVKLDANMVSLEWVAGDEKVALRHYAFEQGESHEERIYNWAGRNPASENLVEVLRVARSGTENVKVTPFFTEKEVEVQERAPEIAQVKLGLRLSDDYLADERFLMLSKPLLKTLGINSHAVQKWVKYSSKIAHTVSNWQVGGSYITFYRHPLDECSVRHHVDVEKGRRLTVDSACVAAEKSFTKNMWGGSCSTAHETPSNCATCMSNKSSEYDGACYTECKDAWTKPCDASCTAAIDNVIAACGNCHKTLSWCGKRGETINSTTLPTTWPTVACTSCSNESSAADCTEDEHVCPQWMKDNYPEATFEKTFLDGDLIAMIEGSLGGVPRNCKYPIYPWYGNKFPLCAQCESVYAAQHNMFLWGGPCKYIGPCELESVTNQTVCAATNKSYKCGCDCGAIINAVEANCAVGQSLCSADIPSRCLTSDSDVYNSCDFQKYEMISSFGNLWSKQMDMSQCYKDGVWATKCLVDQQFTDKQIMFWLKEMEELSNSDLVPASAFASSIQSSTERTVLYTTPTTTTSAITTGLSTTAAITTGVSGIFDVSEALSQHGSCAAFLAILGACILT